MTLADLLRGRDLAQVRAALRADGHALLPALLGREQCEQLRREPQAWYRLNRLDTDGFQALACDEASDDDHVLVLAVLLSDAHAFSGGEIVMTEQRPRMQSRPMVLPLEQGDGVLMAVGARRVQGSRGPYRAVLRYGVARVRAGCRHGLQAAFAADQHF